LSPPKNDHDLRVGIENKRSAAGWDDSYLDQHLPRQDADPPGLLEAGIERGGPALKRRPCQHAIERDDTELVPVQRRDGEVQRLECLGAREPPGDGGDRCRAGVVGGAGSGASRRGAACPVGRAQRVCFLLRLGVRSHHQWVAPTPVGGWPKERLRFTGARVCRLL
jgi:hypothetical protein